MSRKFLTAVDLAKNELQNAAVQNLASAPSSPVKGQLYYDTTGNILYWWNGTAWVSASGGATSFPGYGAITQEQTFGATKTDGVATTAARSDHTHGNPFHDAAAHNNIPLNALLTATANYSMGAFRLTSLGAPTAPSDATTKQYVDDLSAGLSWKEAVRAGTTTNGTLASAFANGSVIDGVTLATGNRILLKNQTTATENGIYTVNASGAPTRAGDADAVGELEGAAVFIQEGTTLADTGWVCTTNAPITPGSTGTAWAQFSGAGAAVPLSRLINTTAPLTGGGDLSADRTLAVNTFTSGASGVVPASGGAATNFLNGAGGWTVPAGTGAPTTRAINTTAPLTGGGDLSADRTLAITSFAGSAAGAVPVSVGGTTNFLRADGTWAAPAGGGTVNRYATDVGTGALTTIAVTHNLGTTDCIVQVYRKASPFDQIECDVQHTSTTVVTLLFAVAPASAEYRCVVVA